MHPELEQLLVLQDRQQKIKQIQTEVETLPLQKKSLEAQLAASVRVRCSSKTHGRNGSKETRARRRHSNGVSRVLKPNGIKHGRTTSFRRRTRDERYENEIRKIEDEELRL